MADTKDGKASVTLPRDGGFTLLEVLVAFAIAAPALALLFSQGATAIGSTRTSALYQEAITRAQSRLEAISGEAIAPGERSGDDGGGFRWRTRIVPLASTQPREPLRGTPYATGTTLYDVTVELSWPGTLGRRTLGLGTRRLGPAATSAP